MTRTSGTLGLAGTVGPSITLDLAGTTGLSRMLALAELAGPADNGERTGMVRFAVTLGPGSGSKLSSAGMSGPPGGGGFAGMVGPKSTLGIRGKVPASTSGLLNTLGRVSMVVPEAACTLGREAVDSLAALDGLTVVSDPASRLGTG